MNDGRPAANLALVVLPQCLLCLCFLTCIPHRVHSMLMTSPLACLPSPGNPNPPPPSLPPPHSHTAQTLTWSAASASFTENGLSAMCACLSWCVCFADLIQVASCAGSGDGGTHNWAQHQPPDPRYGSDCLSAHSACACFHQHHHH